MENENRVKTTITFKKSDHTKLKVFCAENDLSIQDFVEHAALNFLKNKNKPEPSKK